MSGKETLRKQKWPHGPQVKLQSKRHRGCQVSLKSLLSQVLRPTIICLSDYLITLHTSERVTFQRRLSFRAAGSGSGSGSGSSSSSRQRQRQRRQQQQQQQQQADHKRSSQITAADPSSLRQRCNIFPDAWVPRHVLSHSKTRSMLAAACMRDLCVACSYLGTLPSRSSFPSPKANRGRRWSKASPRTAQPGLPIRSPRAAVPVEISATSCHGRPVLPGSPG